MKICFRGLWTTLIYSQLRGEIKKKIYAIVKIWKGKEAVFFVSIKELEILETALWRRGLRAKAEESVPASACVMENAIVEMVFLMWYTVLLTWVWEICNLHFQMVLLIANERGWREKFFVFFNDT